MRVVRILSDSYSTRLGDDMTKHEVKIEVSDSVWIAAESRAKEENTDALNLIRNFLEQALEMEFGVALPKTDIAKEDDTPI